MSLSRRQKRIIYLEAAVPETPVTSPADVFGLRLVRLASLVFAAVSWRREFDASGLMSLSADFEDYLLGEDGLDNEAVLKLIMGARK